MDGLEKVSEFIRKEGLETDLRVLDKSTKNSALAAEALGCTVAEIAKSIVFVGNSICVVVVSGDRKVDPGKLSRVLGETVELASPEKVKESTGYVIGGVPPFPHDSRVRVIPDSSLLRFEYVWAAAGSPNAVFRISTSDLLRTLKTEPANLSA